MVEGRSLSLILPLLHSSQCRLTKLQLHDKCSMDSRLCLQRWHLLTNTMPFLCKLSFVLKLLSWFICCNKIKPVKFIFNPLKLGQGATCSSGIRVQRGKKLVINSFLPIIIPQINSIPFPHFKGTIFAAEITSSRIEELSSIPTSVSI